MGQILVRNLDDDIIERLKTRAKLRGASLEQEIRRILGEASKMTRAELAAQAAWIRSQQKPHKSRAVDLIREDRDR